MSAAHHIAAFSAAFDTARATNPMDVTQRTYSFGGRSLRVTSVGQALGRVIDRPLLRSDKDGSGETLRADLWDASTGVDVPVLAELDDLDERGGAEGERTARSVAGHAVRFSGPDFALWLDRRAHRVVGWIREPEGLAPWHRYRPLQALLSPWLVESPLRLTHASVPAVEGAAALIVGPNGTGKSTCALACLSAGMQILGDDLVTTDTSTREVHALYSVLKSREYPPYRHASVTPMTDPNGEPEWVTFVGEYSPEQVRASARIAVVAFPRLSPGSDSSAAPATRASAMKEFLSADQTHDPADVAAVFEDWTRVADRVPAYHLTVGRDLRGLAETIEKLIRDAS